MRGEVMNDLISRQAVLNATSTTLKITGKENAETVYKYIKKLCDDIKALPSVDTVEVVRCKDCIHYKGMAECECVSESGGTMWFCAWGERKTDG
jgi:hypothetical protein